MFCHAANNVILHISVIQPVSDVLPSKIDVAANEISKDKGAEIADIILPGATYTEKNGLFVNLEGKLQKAYKASYCPGEAREDWQIINDLAEAINNKK